MDIFDRTRHAIGIDGTGEVFNGGTPADASLRRVTCDPIAEEVVFRRSGFGSVRVPLCLASPTPRRPTLTHRDQVTMPHLQAWR